MADNKSILKRLNEILDYCVSGYPTGPFSYSFSAGLFVAPENGRKFDEAMDELLVLVPEASRTISNTKFRDMVLHEIQEQRVKSGPFSQADGAAFQKKILEMPVRTWRVFRPIHGVTVDGTQPPVRIGNFTVYDAKSHSSLLFAASPNALIRDRIQKHSGS